MLLTARVCALTGAYPFLLFLLNKNTMLQKWYCPQKYYGMGNSITSSKIIAYMGQIMCFSNFISKKKMKKDVSFAL